MEESDPLIVRKTQSPRKCSILCVPPSWIDSYELSEQDKNGFMSTVVLLFNSMIGSGILVQAYVFMKSGILNATAMYLIFGFMTFFGISILAKTADSQCIFDFSSLVHKAVGYQGVFWYDLSVVVQNTGSMISFFLIISTLTVDIVESVSESTATSSERWIKISVTIGCFVLMLPLCLIRNFGHLYSISYVSTTMIVGTVLIVVLTGIFFVSTSTDDDDGVLLLGPAMGSFETLGSVVFAFSYTPNLLFAHSAAQESLREVSAFGNMIKATHLTGVLLCYSIGFFGYYAFKDNTKFDILENYTSGVWSILVKVPFVIHLILFIPGDFLVFRYSLLKLLGSSIKTVSDQYYLLLTVVSLVLIVTTSLVLQVYYSSSSALAIVLEINGGLAGSMLAFIFPAIVAMKLLPYHWKSQLIIISLFVVGVVVPIVVLSGLIYEYA